VRKLLPDFLLCAFSSLRFCAFAVKFFFTLRQKLRDRHRDTLRQKLRAGAGTELKPLSRSIPKLKTNIFAANKNSMKEISAQDLRDKKLHHEDFQLIDVREPYEHEAANLGGELIPMSEILGQVDKISKDKPVVVYCRSGNRSGAVIHELEKRFGFTNLFNLRGGILAYARDIDPTLTV
jgi:rhodanese-related sulfurtransferase